MSTKSSVRKLPVLSSFHIPISHRRFQNRAAAVYDMTIDCHDMETVCHIHRLSESILIQDWKGNFDYLKTKLNLTNRKDIEKQFLTIMKEIDEDNIQPTLAAIAHHIPFIYIEQALADQDITNAINRFMDDFNPKNFLQIQIKEDNPIEKQLNKGQPVLTSFEKHLLLEHFNHSLSKNKYRKLIDIEKCLLQYIQNITQINYPSYKNLSYLDPIWFKTFLQWAYPKLNSIYISWLDINQL